MVEVGPAASEKVAEEFPVAAGATQMIIGSDDSFIAVKAVSVTGQVTFDIYDKRPPAPPVQPPPEPPKPQPPPQALPAAEVERLRTLLNLGFITKEEYEQKVSGQNAK